MTQPKISVIVPVYKVEPYLRKCLDSIVGQTYENLEILLVDDGSPDNCGAICDEYAAKDPRITVIHQENAGLSAARNAALDIARGDYIGFVDSDDWIEPDMYEYLMTNALQDRADIAICGHWVEYPDRSVPMGWPRAELMDRSDGLCALLTDQVLHNHVWDKLWKKELFDGVRFPVGRNYEDVAVAYRLFEAADRILCLPEQKHHYLIRSDSIIGLGNLQDLVDCYEAVRERSEDMSSRWPMFRDLLEERRLLTLECFWHACLWAPADQRRLYGRYMHDETVQARQELEKLSLCRGYGFAGRWIMKLLPADTWWSRGAARAIEWLYVLRHGQRLFACREEQKDHV